MSDVSGGRATAAAIPGAELVIIDGMGHSLPRQLGPVTATHLTRLVRHAEAMTAQVPCAARPARRDETRDAKTTVELR